jgi:hypothetical protein
MALLVLPLVGVAGTLWYLISIPTRLSRRAGGLGIAALAGFLVLCACLVFLAAKWWAGYSCPQRSSGPGRVVYGGWAEPTWCTYEQGDSRLAIHGDSGWFFSTWWLIGTIAFATGTLFIAGRFTQSIVRESREALSTSARR